MEAKNESPDNSTEYNLKWIKLTTNDHLDLSLCFNSGQVFHFIDTSEKGEENEYFCEWTGVIFGHCYSFRQGRDGNVYFAVHFETEKSLDFPHKLLLEQYFSLDLNYIEMMSNWLSKLQNLPEMEEICGKDDFDKVCKEKALDLLYSSSFFKNKISLAESKENFEPNTMNTQLVDLKNFSGLRMLNPCFIQTIFAFICSQNNNITNIKKMVRILYSLGQRIVRYKGHDFHIFPSLEILSSDDISEIFKPLGYRNKYVQDTAKFLDKIIKMEELVVDFSKCELNGSDLELKKLNKAKRLRKKKDLSTDSIQFDSKNLSYDDSTKYYKYSVKNPIFSSNLPDNAVLDRIFENQTYERITNNLKILPGISDKVADCIALYAGRFSFVVPFDAHMIKITKSLLVNQSGTEKTNFTNKQLKTYRQIYFNMFKENSGHAQIFLFDTSVNSRDNNSKKTKKSNKKEIKNDS